MDQDIAISELAAEYRGIEGFYLLNTQGQLGYISTDGSSYVKETFPQIDDPDFLSQHPRFVEELHQFILKINPDTRFISRKTLISEVYVFTACHACFNLCRGAIWFLQQLVCR